MADWRSRAEWGRASSLMALLANIHRDSRKRRRPYRPQDFDPHHAGRRKGARVTGEQVANDIMRMAEKRGR